MAKKSKKEKKNVAVTAVAVEEVFGTTYVPVGMAWAMGVDPEVRDACYAEMAAKEAGKDNGGPKEVFDAGGNCPMDIEAEVEKAAETQAEYPVGGFNRAGMDAMLSGRIGPEVVVNVAQKVKQSSRVVIGTGYRGTVRQMLLNGEGGEAIIKKIASMYEAQGKSHEYGMDRGNRILTDMMWEMKKGVFGEKAV